VPVTTPSTTTITTTATKGGYHVLQNYLTNSDLQTIDQYIRSKMQNFVNAQIIAVWVETLTNSNNYRVQYLLSDGSIQEVIVSYITSTHTSQITSSNQIVPPVAKNITNTNVTQAAYTPVASNITMTNQSTTTTPSPAYNTTTVVKNISTIFNPNWKPIDYIPPTYITNTTNTTNTINTTNTTNTSTVTAIYFPGITTTPNFTTLADSGTINANTVTPTWDYSQYLQNDTSPTSPADNITSTNTSFINSTWGSLPPTPNYTAPPSSNYNNTTIVKWDTSNFNESIVPIPPKIPQRPYVLSKTSNSSNTNQLANTQLVLTVTSNTSIINNQTATNSNAYTSLNNWSTNSDFLTVDRFVRDQLPQLSNCQVIAVWMLVQIKVGISYRIQYLLDSNTIEVVASKLNSNKNFVIVSNNLTSAYQQNY
jgi:hypothetical protein